MGTIAIIKNLIANRKTLFKAISWLSVGLLLLFSIIILLGILCYNNIKKAVDKVNKMFPDTKFSFKLPYLDRLKKRSEESELNRLNGNMGTPQQQQRADGDVKTS